MLFLNVYEYHSMVHRLSQFMMFVLLESSPFPRFTRPSPGLGGFCASCNYAKLISNKYVLRQCYHRNKLRIDMSQHNLIIIQTVNANNIYLCLGNYCVLC